MIELRTLVIVLGDQLDLGAAAFDGFDAACDAVWMAEVDGESKHVWSAKQRTALFLAAMRHFRDDLRAGGRQVHYRQIDDPANTGTLVGELQAALANLQPGRLVMTAPGDWRVLQGLQGVAAAAALALEIRDDRHFYCTVREFAAYAGGRTALRMEFFYRALRERHQVLMDGPRQPCGGRWNFDTENRGTFSAAGPGALRPPASFEPDSVTREVLDLVNVRFREHPGSLDAFAWPVTRADALRALKRFIDDRLPEFGPYQDAMWTDEPWLNHSQLSAALNLKLLAPREVVDAAEFAYREGRAPLASAEGFIRQILGWREYVRGVYWTQMPRYLQSNALAAHEPLPSWYWTGDTDMGCLHAAIGQTLDHGYAHHIQRLMVTGLYALLLGVEPRQIHEWYLAVYVDAVEWAELPNVLGMSQYADRGFMASKPYVASGKYIDRMSNHCGTCRYDPDQRAGEHACPFTTLYWDFLARHAPLLGANPRMAFQMKNLARLDAVQRSQIAGRAAAIRRGEVGGGSAEAAVGDQPPLDSNFATSCAGIGRLNK